MAKNLVIVESPAKAKTIEGYLGKDFLVKASYGHIRDLPKGNDAIDIANGFKPRYEVSEDKDKVVNELRKLVEKAETVWLATDEDREGEAISWHLAEVLQLDPEKTRRIVFHEITRKAITEAVANPRGIDYHLVDAQQARRILDRLVGFELSPVLWTKVKTGLSAGRVQSVAVRLISEREREIDRFTSASFVKVSGDFLAAGKKLKAELTEKLKDIQLAEAFLNECKGATYSVASLEVKPGKKSPSPPFITSTLQQEASRKHGFSVSQTMVLAQKLYESGKITYMRTDSVNLSDAALEMAKETIVSQYGSEFYQHRKFKTKSSNAQEAHEAIRPTDFNETKVSEDSREQKLYELIWKRTIASQMADAEIEKTIVGINISTSNRQLTATGEVLKFEGFLKVYLESRDEEEEDDDTGVLPPVTLGQVLTLKELVATERFSRPPSRFTEASLVKKLEELGIGRPSTYAPTISTIMKREYVVKEDREGKVRPYQVVTLQADKISQATKTEITGAEKAKLFPTDMGMLVTDFLVLYFPDIVDYSFTAQVENEFDEIAQGKISWNQMISTFYGPFHLKVKETKEKAERVQGERILGVDPVSGFQVSVRLGRYGPLVQMEGKDGKPMFANLRQGQRLETIALEEAMELFRLPRELGEFEDKVVKANIGRFGPYVQHNSKFYTIPKTGDPYTITLPEAIELIEAKRISDAAKVIAEFDNGNIRVLNGRWGPYLAISGENVKIPKGVEASSLTEADCTELYQQHMAKVATEGPKKKASFRGKKK
ncbi:MAG: type I DNA topoisomerase [Sphingobacteriia bacterium]|nr:type I DNA topoisomerase [Sphingobacteriia bacterium]